MLEIELPVSSIFLVRKHADKEPGPAAFTARTSLRSIRYKSGCPGRHAGQGARVAPGRSSLTKGTSHITRGHRGVLPRPRFWGSSLVEFCRTQKVVLSGSTPGKASLLLCFRFSERGHRRSSPWDILPSPAAQVEVPHGCKKLKPVSRS